MNKDILCYANMCISAQAMTYRPCVSYVYLVGMATSTPVLGYSLGRPSTRVQF